MVIIFIVMKKNQIQVLEIEQVFCVESQKLLVITAV